MVVSFVLFSLMLTALPVALAAMALEAVPRAARWGSGKRLAVAHTLLTAAAPLVIAVVRDSPYGDIYPPYLVVPGAHITFLADRLLDRVFPWLLGFLGSFPASVLTVIVGPGLIGMLVGGVQWYVIGAAWDRLWNRVDPPHAG